MRKLLSSIDEHVVLPVMYLCAAGLIFGSEDDTTLHSTIVCRRLMTYRVPYNAIDNPVIAHPNTTRRANLDRLATS
jgi:hypothetical protein